MQVLVRRFATYTSLSSLTEPRLIADGCNNSLTRFLRQGQLLICIIEQPLNPFILLLGTSHRTPSRLGEYLEFALTLL